MPPFGIWKGVDGSEVYAIFKGEAYDAHKQYNKDMSKDEDMNRLAEENFRNMAWHRYLDMLVRWGIEEAD